MGSQSLLKNYVKANAWVYLFAILMVMISNITQSYFPKILGRFIDELHKGISNPAMIYNYSLLLLGTGAAYATLFGVGQLTVMRLGRRFEFHTRQMLFRHFSLLSENYFSKRGIGALLSHVINDVTSVREMISNGVNQTTNAVFLISSTIVMMLLSSIPVYLILISIIPLLAIPFLIVYFGPRIRNRSMKVQESLAGMTESAEEQFGGMRVTKTFAVEDMARRRFGERVDSIRDSQLQLVRMSSLFQALLPFMGAAALTLALLFGGFLTIYHRITLGNFVELTLYLRMIVNPMQQIGNVINTMQRSRASLDRLNTLLAEVPDIQESADAVALREGSLGIDVKNLSFSYPTTNHLALQDISISIAPGKTLGIVGRTGSGKTTLMKLLLRTYDPPSDTIRIGGVDIKKIKLKSLRTQIAYVPQDGFLFSTTIRDNIAFSDRRKEMGEVTEAARQANIYDNIMQFPDQFDTKLGERGVTLSGGQRQRTSLARGFIKHSPVLILDDSVSAVDAVTEKLIIDNIRRNRRNKTTIIIAHRISAVQHADEIIVMDEGRIVQRGTHEQLLAAGGFYASLYYIQGEGTKHA